MKIVVKDIGPKKAGISAALKRAFSVPPTYVEDHKLLCKIDETPQKKHGS